MRVTFVLRSADRSGGVRVVATYAEALRARGHEVALVSTPTAVPLERRIKNALKLRGFARFYPAVANPIDENPQLDHTVLESDRPVSADDVPDADIIIATWWETAEWVAEMPLNKGEKLYLIQHDETVFPILTEAERERVRATWRLPFTRVVVSQWIRDRIDAGHAQTPPTVLIPNGVDLQRFDAPPREKQDRPTVAMMYSPVGFKAMDVGAAALEILRERVPDLRAVVFGAGEIDPLLPLPDWIEYHRDPPQAELARLYGSVDAYLFPSRLEGFGLPILEAMACRTPVVGCETGAAMELIRDGAPDAAGRLVPVDDADALASAAESVLALEPAAWRALSDHARARAEANAWPAVVDRFEELLQRVAAGV